MTCWGVAVTRARVEVGVAEMFRDNVILFEYRRLCQQHGLSVYEYLNNYRDEPERNGLLVRLSGTQSGVRVTPAGDVELFNVPDHLSTDLADLAQQLTTLQGLTALFVGQQMQAKVLQTLAEFGLQPRDAQQHSDGSIEVRVNLSSAPDGANLLYRETARVKIDLTGALTLITENGSFDTGKRKLELLLTALGSQLKVVPSGVFETHRHDEQVMRLQQTNLQ